MISGVEKAWLRNEKCLVIFGKSFQFFKKWEGDFTEAEFLSDGVTEDIHGPNWGLFDKNSSSFEEYQGGSGQVFEERFKIDSDWLRR